MMIMEDEVELSGAFPVNLPQKSIFSPHFLRRFLLIIIILRSVSTWLSLQIIRRKMLGGSCFLLLSLSLAGMTVGRLRCLVELVEGP